MAADTEEFIKQLRAEVSPVETEDDPWDEDTTTDVKSVESNTSVSQFVKKSLFDEEYALSPLQKNIERINEGEAQSVYEVAQRENKTLAQWVEEDPEYAQRYAESVLVQWQKLLSSAATNGTLRLEFDDGQISEVAISKNQVTLITNRVKIAQDEVLKVEELVALTARNDEQKKDHLIRNMYRRALTADTKAAMYLIDRVEGRPTEAKAADISMDNAYNVYMIICTLFDKQLEVLNSGNGAKLVCCSRRAGKTHLLVAIMLIECLRRPRTKCMYIGETAELSEGLINKAANDIIDTCKLKDRRGKRFNWRKMDNGSEIMVRGLSNTKDPDQIRGNAAKVIVIDEFFHLKSELLEYLQREVLEPMQLDYADDYKFICAGTPPRVKGTYGEMVWKTWDVDKFSWTWRDNPHPVNVEKRKEYVDKILHDKGIDWTSSFARREYNGEWVYDDDLLLYPEFHCYDPRESVPTLHVSRVFFGIDYGVGDNDTLIGIAWDDDERRGFEFWEDKFNRLDIKDRTISQLEYLCAQVEAAWRTAFEFFPGMDYREANKRILWDADDNDQHLTDYMNVNIRIHEEGFEGLRLQIQNAHKTDKTIMQDRIRDCLRRADLLLLNEGKAAHECMSTILKRGPNGEVYNEIDEKAYHPDLLPAMRYALYNALGVA